MKRVMNPLFVPKENSRHVTNPKVPTTCVVTCEFASTANLASPKSETYEMKKHEQLA